MNIHHLTRTLGVFLIALPILIFCIFMFPVVQDAWKRRKRRLSHPTAADALKLIRQVMHNYDSDEATKLWYILTALRGPDNKDVSLKLSTTGVIRHAVYGYSTSGGSSSPDTQSKRQYRSEHLYSAEIEHFIDHAKQAFRYLDLKW